MGRPTNTITYSYGDTVWKDKLTSYNGRAITYDSIGNPLTYNGNTYTWEEGRQLKSIVGTSGNINCMYSDSGIRTEKNIGGVPTKYHLVGDKVTFETTGSDSIYYTYDSSGNLVSMNLNGVEYYYIRNVQGDIIGLFDKSCTQVVSYTYDSWGKLISTTGTLASTVGVKNPYRYRGYRYDTETGLYYLQSRYYNPEWGRFINADALAGQIGELLGHNVFAYCKNNPVTWSDPSGFRYVSATEGYEESNTDKAINNALEYIRNNERESEKLYNSNKDVKFIAKTEELIASTAAASALGSLGIGKVVAKSFPAFPYAEQAVGAGSGILASTFINSYEIYGEKDVAVIFVEAHRAQAAQNLTVDLSNVRAFEHIITKIDIYLRNPGPNKNWKHSTRGFDY